VCMQPNIVAVKLAGRATTVVRLRTLTGSIIYVNGQ